MRGKPNVERGPRIDKATAMKSTSIDRAPAFRLSPARSKMPGPIDYNRGHIQITNSPALADASCECYETVKRNYDRLLNNK